MCCVTHCPGLDLHALQHPRLEADVLDIQAVKYTMRRRKAVVLQGPPHPVYLIRAQRDEIRDAPEERERIQARRLLSLLSQGVHLPLAQTCRSRHQRVCDEQSPIEQQHQGAGKVSAQLDGLDARQNVRIDVSEGLAVC